MFRKLAKFKNVKAQNTAEYALLISLVVAGIIAMQTYAQRALQGRIHDASKYMTGTTHQAGLTDPLDTTVKSYQYEPEYLKRQYDVTSKGEEKVAQGVEYVGGTGASAKGIETEGSSNRTRALGGYEEQTWCASTMNK